MEENDQDELPIQHTEAILDMIDHRMYKEKPKEVNRRNDNNIKIMFDNKVVEMINVEKI